MDFEFNSLTKIRRGEFPLHHDHVLKLRYLKGCPLRFSFLTCSSYDLVSACKLFSAFPLVKDIEVFSIDNFYL